MNGEQNKSEEEKRQEAQRKEEQRKIDENQYLTLRTHYKNLSIKVLRRASAVAFLIVVFLLVNKFLDKSLLSGVQYIFLFLSLIAFCISVGLHLLYDSLLKDPVSDLSENITVYAPGKSKTLAERIAKNRKTVYNNNVFFWLGLLFLLAALFISLLPSNNHGACGEKEIKNSGDGKLKVTFVQINDVYEIAPLNGGKIGGMARVATINRVYKARNENTMLIMAGDFVSPSVFNNIEKDSAKIAGKQMIDAMNAAGVDLAIFGNHEFDISKKQLQQCINESNFEWVASNAHNIVSSGSNKTGTAAFKKNGKDIPEYLIKTFEDADGTIAKIGFIGITVPTIIKDSLFVSFDSTIMSAKRVYEKIKNSCDAVIAVTHQSIEEDEKLAIAIPQLALIIGGHEHDMQFKKVGNVFITKAHSNAKSAFIINLLIDKKKKKVTVDPSLKNLDSTVAIDPLTDAVVGKWISYANDYLQEHGYHPDSIINSGISFDGRDEQVRNRSTNLTRLIVKAMETLYPAADIAVFNAGSIRVDDIINFPVREYDVLRALPYGGTVKEALIRGDTLIRMFNEGEKNKNTGGFLQYPDHVKKSIVGWLIKTININPLGYYKVAIADYLLRGEEKNLEFLKWVKVINKGEFSPGDPGSDITIAVINQMKKID